MKPIGGEGGEGDILRRGWISGSALLRNFSSYPLFIRAPSFPRIIYARPRLYYILIGLLFFFSRSDRFIFRFVFGGEELFYLLVKKKWGKRIPSFPRGKEKEGEKSNPG